MMTAANEPEAQMPLDIEQHFTIEEIAKKWRMKRDTVYRMFKEEPGVFRPSMGEGERHMTLVPLSVIQRVHRRMEKPPKVAGRVVS